MECLRGFVFLCLVILGGSSLSAEVLQLIISEREPFAADVSDKVGPYERILGRVVYSIDPVLQANEGIVDLRYALTNGNGRIEFYGDFEILAPLDLSKAQPTVLYDVNNRGRRLWGSEPFFLRRGYITVSSGWIAEVPVDSNFLRLEAPVAHDDGVPVVGTVRAEFVTDMVTEQMSISDRGQLAYEPVINELENATLTRRLRETDAPQAISREQWDFRQVVGPREEGSGLIEGVIVLEHGFQPGWIYELTYVARGSIVQGLGFAAIRDLVAFLKHDRSESNPLRTQNGNPIATRVIGEGRSQSGRALRMFLYEGFNADEQGRRVFDGVMPVIAGGGQGFFNHRFASPTRTATQHEGHLFPVDRFPFTYGDETDPFTGRTDGLLGRARASGTLPKVMHLDTSSEYWHRSASLVVTDPLGTLDVVLPDEVRVYVFAGSQHSPATRPSSRGQQLPNPTNYRPFQEALFLALDRWISDGTPPPDSVYPKIGDDTLVKWSVDDSGWTTIPAVQYPSVIQQPEVLDYGPFFDSERRIDHHPPIRTGQRYAIRVPKVDENNNEVGALRLPSIAVPVATYTSWNLRNSSIGSEEALLSLTGGYIPFPVTVQDRLSTEDPRVSIRERYKNFDDYFERFMAATRQLVFDGYLLEEHVPAMKSIASSHRSMIEP